MSDYDLQEFEDPYVKIQPTSKYKIKIKIKSIKKGKFPLQDDEELINE